jgi:hypothetical protein
MCVNSCVGTYKKYLSCAKRRDIPFELTEDVFDKIISQECYICGSDTYHNGVDRINSDGSYNINNCKACCRTCNYIKRDLNMLDFLVHLILIADKSIYNKFLKYDDVDDNKEYNLQRNRSAMKLVNDECNIIDLCSPYVFLSEDEKVEICDDVKVSDKNIHTVEICDNVKVSDDISKSIKINELDNVIEKKRYENRRKIAKIRGHIVGVDVDENYFVIRKKLPMSSSERGKKFRAMRKEQKNIQ